MRRWKSALARCPHLTWRILRSSRIAGSKCRSSCNGTPGSGFPLTLRRRRAASSRVAAADISVQMIDRLRLVRDDGVNEIADADDSDQLVALQHGEMPDTVMRYQLHAVFHRVAGRN